MKVEKNLKTLLTSVNTYATICLVEKTQRNKEVIIVRRGPFDYRKLRGRIKEKCGTQSTFARTIGLSDVSVSNKLNNNIDWGQEEIDNAVCALDIPITEIHTYFFTHKVEKN